MRTIWFKTTMATILSAFVIGNTWWCADRTRGGLHAHYIEKPSDESITSDAKKDYAKEMADRYPSVADKLSNKLSTGCPGVEPPCLTEKEFQEIIYLATREKWASID